MKSAAISLLALIIGCAFVQRLSAAEPAKVKEKTLYSFSGGLDGGQPYVNVIDVKGTLYGTTYIGGDYEGGTVFSLGPKSGEEVVLHSFYDNPQAPLLDVKDTLYGTTQGADSSEGTLFSFDLSTGDEKTLYTFCRQKECADGAYPSAGLINVKSRLYGTTIGGGASGIFACGDFGCGTVFSLDPSTKAEKVLYSFCSQANCADGAWPKASLLNVSGTLYGTAAIGGVAGCYENQGCGTVFSLDLNTGEERTIYTFCSQPGCADGANPFAGLIDVNGVLYGTVSGGGDAGDGAVFEIDPTTGVETVLHSFAGGADGQYPYASLIDRNGTLYGTTLGGGPNSGGTVFSVDPDTSAESVLYAFCSQQNCTDGQAPEGGLIDVQGKLYGTTVGGGASQGTVFVLKETH